MSRDTLPDEEADWIKQAKPPSSWKRPDTGKSTTGCPKCGSVKMMERQTNIFGHVIEFGCGTWIGEGEYHGPDQSDRCRIRELEQQVARLNHDIDALTEENSREFQRGYDACTSAIKVQAEPMSAELLRLRPEVARLTQELAESRFRPMGDNHHNAAACPYCNPKWSELQRKNAHLKAMLLEQSVPIDKIGRVILGESRWTPANIDAEVARRIAKERE